MSEKKKAKFIYKQTKTVKQEKTPQEKIERKIKKIITNLLKNKKWLELLGILTAVLTVGSWIIRLLWYSYTCGIFSVYNINTSYINLKEENILFSVIRLGGVFVCLMGLNFVSFNFLTFKDKSKFKIKKILLNFLFWLFLTVCFLLISIFLMEHNIFKGIKDFFIYSTEEKCSLISQAFKYCILFNLFGIVFAIVNWLFCFFRWFKPNKESSENSKSSIFETKYKYFNVLLLLISILISVLVCSVCLFIQGWSDEYQRKKFKIVIDSLETNHSISEKYILNYDERNVVIYPVIYEDTDICILTRIYKQEDKIKIDYYYQKIIENSGIEIHTVDDIYFLILNE